MYLKFPTIPIIILGISLITVSPASAQQTKQDKKAMKAERRMSTWVMPIQNMAHLGTFSVDSLSVLSEQKKIRIFFSKPLSYIPWREDMISRFQSSIQEQLGRGFRDYDIEIITDGHKLPDLVPNKFRQQLPIDSLRFPRHNTSSPAFIMRPHRGPYDHGLDHKIIALWHSHGWYYESKLDRWEWQRARLHSTVEDILPMSFVLPYLAPMLENAGATVIIPRERDIQTHEVVVDNDFSTGSSEIILNGIEPDTLKPGFRWKDTLYANENPFLSGSHLEIAQNQTGSVVYLPDIPEDGEYAVYISYARTSGNSDKVKYTIRYSGGKDDVIVNQQMGAGTWIYMGTYFFEQGKHRNTGSVTITADGSGKGIITTDAIRFGGGMGTVARKPDYEQLPNRWSLKTAQTTPEEGGTLNPEAFTWKLSGKPRYMEAARYYLQYAGMPDSMVYSLNGGKNDYNDDYQSRGEWVNYLMGNPKGPSGHRTVPGLGIPVDLSLAFHTDAGVTPNDSVIGTLAIYSSDTDEGIFPDGQSKMASRDLCDIVQTQIVTDIRKTFNPAWTRRGLWNKQYSEAYRPNVPAMLLELLSHQNLADMSLGLDPRFRFAVSRAVYKGILKYLAYQGNRDYVVQPLPVDHFAISRMEGKKIKLSWSPLADPLEPTAVPQYYKVYMREGTHGFDQGFRVVDTSLVIELEKYNTLYSFKITALNRGGESFPSEILSAAIAENSAETALVVNAFDRISGPAIMDGNIFSGLAQFEDQGVPYIRNIGETGAVYDFNRKSLWLDDDSPGWGASYGNMEGKVIPGNTFDYPYIHGKAILAAGMSFISVSDEAFITAENDLKKYAFVDIIYGEEKATPCFHPTASGEQNKFDFTLLTPGMQKKLEKIAVGGGNIFISGAYVGTDPVLRKDTVAINFAEEVLHYRWRTNHAVRKGKIYTTDYAKPLLHGPWKFNTDYDPEIYAAESPDAIEPAGSDAICAFRYTENNTSAGIAYRGDYRVVVLGFPFETIADANQRVGFMKQVIDFFRAGSSKMIE